MADNIPARRRDGEMCFAALIAFQGSHYLKARLMAAKAKRMNAAAATVYRIKANDSLIGLGIDAACRRPLALNPA